MKVLLCLFFVISSAFAQDPADYFKLADAKIYSLKTKGVKDFVVDVVNPKLTKQMNDQQTFGKINHLFFRVYWTSMPERISIEVHGMPEGFKEVKEELKAGVYPLLDNVIPQATVQRFAGYKLSRTSKPKEFLAEDVSGIALIPSYVIKYDAQDRLIEVVGQKPIGSLVVTPNYEKTNFSDGRWVLKSQGTTTSEGGQTITIRKELTYGQVQGIGVLTELDVKTEQKFATPDAKTAVMTDSIEFKNYKINDGTALKYFLGEGSKPTAKPAAAPAPKK